MASCNPRRALRSTCNGCGSCCDPVSLPFTQDEARRNTRIEPRTRKWLLEELTPMPRREAREKEPWLFTTNIHGRFLEDSLPFYYRCKWFDEETRACTNYDDRPEPCRDYPWGDGPPKPNAALAPSCSFREDIGQPVILRTKPA